MLVNVTPSSGLIGDLHGSLVLSQTEDDGLLLRPAGGKHVRALEPPWFLVNSVDPWSTAWSFFFPIFTWDDFLPSWWFSTGLQNYTGGINRRIPRHAESGPDRSWKQQRMARTTRSLHLWECLFYLGNHEPQNCLKGTSPPSYLGKTWKNSKYTASQFFPQTQPWSEICHTRKRRAIRQYVRNHSYIIIFLVAFARLGEWQTRKLCCVGRWRMHGYTLYSPDGNQTWQWEIPILGRKKDGDFTLLLPG